MRASVLFLAVAFVWMLQLILSLLQTKRFHQQVANLRKQGPMTAVGLSGRNWTLKKYGVLVVGDDRRVIRAQKLSGVTVFSSLQDVPALVGLEIDRFFDPEPIEGVKKKLWSAFMNAASFIKKHEEKLLAESEEQDD